MMVLGLIQLILGVTVFVIEFRRGSISIFLWGVLLLMFHIPHAVTSFNINIEYSIETYCKASLFVCAFILIYIFVICVLQRIYKRFDAASSLLYNKGKIMKCDYKIEKYYYISIIITTAVMAIYIISISGSLWNSSWGGILGADSSNIFLNILFNAIPFFVDCAGGIFIYYCFRKEKLKHMIFLSVLIIFSVVIRREKQRFLVLAVPFIVIMYIKNRKITLKSLLKYLSIVIVGYFMVLVIAYMRDGSLGDFISNFSFSNLWDYGLNNISSSGGELSLRNAFYKYIEKKNEFNGFNTGADYIRMLLFWLPTSLSMGVKPDVFAVTMGSAWLGVSYQTQYSMHPTLYGECFANLNVYGVLLAIFWACFAFFIDKMICKNKSYLIRCGLVTLVGVNYIMIARGSTYNAFFTVVVSWLILKLVFYFCKKVQIKIKK